MRARPRRVMVIGGSGSGKSTVARAIGAACALPVVHLDRLYWQPGWVARSRAEMADLVRAEIAKEAWVLDGNYAETFEERAARADMVVFLDVATPLRLWRVIRRRLTMRAERPDIAPGCPEQIDLDFLRFVARYRREGRPRALALLAAAPAHVTVHHLRRRREVRRFTATLAEAHDGAGRSCGTGPGRLPARP